MKAPKQTAVCIQTNPADCGTNMLRISCTKCRLRDLCVPGGIPPDELSKLDTLLSMRLRIKKGETLFHAGDSFKSLYALRQGFFKTRLTIDDGREQLTGFQIPGELLGLEAMATDYYHVDAIALEDSEVCVLPYAELGRVAQDSPALQRQIHRVLSREIVHDQGMMMLLGTMKADQRVAAFLINLSERYRILGYSPKELVLRMTRADIGSYLGLKLETISRSFSKLQDNGIISVNGREILLHDLDQLRETIDSTCKG